MFYLGAFLPVSKLQIPVLRDLQAMAVVKDVVPREQSLDPSKRRVRLRHKVHRKKIPDTLPVQIAVNVCSLQNRLDFRPKYKLVIVEIIEKRLDSQAISGQPKRFLVPI